MFHLHQTLRACCFGYLGEEMVCASFVATKSSPQGAAIEKMFICLLKRILKALFDDNDYM